jgi:lysophospholipase L1-like esterase
MFLSAVLALAQPTAQKPFEFKDGDRIVWIGNTLVEREQRYGYWETALLAANADKKITVRNLGWSGDTVHAEARGRFDFDKPDMCLKQLVNLTLELKPTVIFIAYGTNESFEGKDGLSKFEKGLEKLLDALKPADARIVLFTPLPFSKSASLPDPKEHNLRLGRYSEVIRKVAKDRKHYLADLFAEATSGTYARITGKLTDEGATGDTFQSDNGIHLTWRGYANSAKVLLDVLGCTHPDVFIDLEPLRKAIIEKNELFFHRWRPQNETYLFGFRKHEQGKNAKEVAEFDPLVSKAEEEIEKIRKTLKK